MSSCFLHCLPEIQSNSSLSSLCLSLTNLHLVPRSFCIPLEVAARLFCNSSEPYAIIRPECQKPPQKYPQPRKGISCLDWVLTDRSGHGGWLLLEVFNSQGQENGRELSFCFLDLVSRAGWVSDKGRCTSGMMETAGRLCLVCSMRWSIGKTSWGNQWPTTPYWNFTGQKVLNVVSRGNKSMHMLATKNRLVTLSHTRFMNLQTTGGSLSN